MIEHIVAGGCSFTSDGIGGVPPTKSNPYGGCSFIDNDGFQSAEPRTWVSILAKQLKVKSLVNVAANGQGNICTSLNLINLLTKFNYDKEKTLVLFNISDPARLDIMCDWHSDQASPYISWPYEILPYKYIDAWNNSSAMIIKKNMGIEQVEMTSSTTLQGLLSFLKDKNYNFRFLSMKNYSDCVSLSPLIDEYALHWIKIGPECGMQEWCVKNNLTVSQDDTHPSLLGHQKIAELVIQNL